MSAPEAPTLADFLLARIAEDEVDANAGFAWYSDGRRFGIVDLSEYTDVFVADPEFVLAECAARRLIIALHADDLEHYCPTDDGSVYFNYANGWAEAAEYPQICPTLRLLALPYVDHEDYRKEWGVS